MLTPLILSELLSRKFCFLSLTDSESIYLFLSSGTNFLRVSELSYYLQNNLRNSNQGGWESIWSGFLTVPKCPPSVSSHAEGGVAWQWRPPHLLQSSLLTLAGMAQYSSCSNEERMGGKKKSQYTFWFGLELGVGKERCVTYR